MQAFTLLLSLIAAAWLTGCASVGGQAPGKHAASRPDTGRPGGYYLDDGPGENPPPNLHAIPDAVPKAEPLHRFANRPYSVMGRNYVPDVSGRPYKAQGLASWYGRRYHGKPTASGEIYDMYGMTAAHPTLPIPSYVRVTNPANGKSVVVRINDRGPFHEERLIDLSYTAAYKLDILRGVTLVEVERLFPAESGPVFATPAGGSGVLQTAALPQPVRPLASEPLVSESARPAANAPAQAAEPTRPPGLYLQVGAFANPAAAEALIERLRGLPALPGVHSVPGGGLIRVQAGPFADAAAAERAAQLIQEALGIRPHKVQAHLRAMMESV